MTKFNSACLLVGIFLMLFIVVAATTANTDQKALQLLREANHELKLRKAQIEQLQKQNQHLRSDTEQAEPNRPPEEKKDKPHFVIYFLLLTGMTGWITANCFIKKTGWSWQIWQKNRFKFVFLSSLFLGGILIALF